MSNNQSPSTKPLSISAIRQKIDEALAAGDAETAQSAAAQLAQREKLGPWEKTAIGRVALAAKDYTQANTWLTEAYDVLPDEGAILVDLASTKAALRQWRRAAELLNLAIAQRSDIPDLHERHGIYLANCGDREASIQALERALTLDPTRASTLAQLGERYIDADDVAAAETTLQMALDHDPDCSPALWNLALLRERAGALSEALDLLGHVPEAQAETAQARHRRGQILLSMGQLEEGWAEYAARLKNLDYVSWQYALRVPYWRGEDLTNKHLVVWADQGLGEQLLTASLIKDVTALCGQLTFACDPRLVSLLARSLPDVQIVPLTALKDRGPTLGPIDLQATLSELGAVLRPSLEVFPTPAAFLKPDPARRAAFRESLNTKGELVVGISWRSENAMVGKEKSTSLLDHWSSVLKIPGVRFISLQYGDVSAEIAAAQAATGVDIARSDIDPTRDVDGFVALVAAMDAVISTSNTAVHVAGGLGVSTWAVLPKAYGRPWYWYDKGDMSPWYQNLSLVRSQGEWASALSEAAEKAGAHLDTQA